MSPKKYLAQEGPIDHDFWGYQKERRLPSKKSLIRFGLATILASGSVLLFGQSVAGAPANSMRHEAKVAHKVRESSAARLKAVRWLSNLALKEQKQIWAMEDVMQRPHTRIVERRTTAISIPAKIQELANWRGVRAEVEDQYRNPPHLADFLCIHSGIKDGHWTKYLDYIGGGEPAGDSQGEASWENPGVDWRGRPSIYYGGLQMDISFMKHFGPELFEKYGTADHWPAIQQIWVAERAVEADGDFGRWPNTAKACGLPT